MSRLAETVETLFVPLFALLVSAVVLAAFVAVNGADPLGVFQTLYRGGFGTWFSFQNTLQRAAPLMLTALCTALPARLGLIVIGGEGALVIGGLAATVAALSLPDASPVMVSIAMALAATLSGGLWIGLVGGLRHYRGINETIASLLFNYLAIALLLHLVTGPLRDPESLNKPATPAIGDANMIGTIPGMDVHYGLLYGLIACVLAYVLFVRTPFGFATRIVCPTRPSWCSRGSCSSRCYPAKPSTGACCPSRDRVDVELGWLGVPLALFAGAIRVGTPFLFVSLGECLTERSGRINLGLEGNLVLGAMSAYAVSYLTGSPWLGVLAAGGAGMVLGGLHAWICGHPRVNDIAAGIALMIFGTGLAFFWGKPYIQPVAPRLPAFDLGAWSGIPQVRDALQVNVLFLLGLALAPLLAFVLRQTRWGLVVRTGGDSRDAALALGFHVNRVRALCTMIGGFLAGVGGSFLSLYYPGSWNEGLSSGQGLMAVALVVFARWEPMRCLYAALLFGAAGALGPALQSVGITSGYYLFNAAPYVLTLLLMLATCSPDRALAGMPQELGAAK